MTKAEHERREHLLSTLQSLGFTLNQSEALRRISNTLRRWHELECGDGNGCIERDETTNKPYWVSEWGARWTTGKRCRYPIADRERGALKRLKAIIRNRNDRQPMETVDGKIVRPSSVSTYIQTDPRGAALYILRPGDVPAGCNPDSYYNRGICVY